MSAPLPAPAPRSASCIPLSVEPDSADELEVALAWAGCTVDGRLHPLQWRAVRAVLARHPSDVPVPTAVDRRRLLDRVEARVPRLEVGARRRLFLSTAWVTIADARSHGKELYLLCELRRALALSPAEARRLYNLARASRLSSPSEPTLGELERLLARA